MDWLVTYFDIVLECPLSVVKVLWDSLPVSEKARHHSQKLQQEISTIQFPPGTRLSRNSTNFSCLHLSNDILFDYLTFQYYHDYEGRAVYRHFETYELLSRREYIDQFRLYAKRVEWIVLLADFFAQRSWVVDFRRKRVEHPEKEFKFVLTHDVPVIGVLKMTDHDDDLPNLYFSLVTGYYAETENAVPVPMKESEWWATLESLM